MAAFGKESIIRNAPSFASERCQIEPRSRPLAVTPAHLGPATLVWRRGKRKWRWVSAVFGVVLAPISRHFLTSAFLSAQPLHAKAGRRVKELGEWNKSSTAAHGSRLPT